MKLIELNMDKIKTLCAKHKVNKLFVFGSVLKDTFTNESDIDFVVDVTEVAKLAQPETDKLLKDL